jgi:hypothetical protein
LKKISFVPVSAEVEKNIPMPKPAKLYIPEWYKESPSFVDYDNNSYTNKLSFYKPGVPSATIKTCMPFLDTLSFGYIQETWCDIFIEYKNNQLLYHYSYNPDVANPIISDRSTDAMAKMPVPTGFNGNIFFHWSRVWNPVLPKGYSSLITHPFNRDDLPFRCASGIIDSDRYFLNGKVGFFIKENFTGLIPKGTPMYQIIPFKKESWKIKDFISKNKTSIMMEQQKNNIQSVFSGGYKKKYWNKKDFS